MGVPTGWPSGNFQSSLRDFSSLESLPRTASWAKFSRPCGTHFATRRFSHPLFSPEVRLSIIARAQSLSV